ncbi:HAD-IIIA family hydrolase [Lacticaseibacillus parakribbianus]|uniref:HAD-IIIA family hydrolase n=1 Tax=Lacticaseibacillus parakribbianus TaxID=2970927 RepID=UPI0021CB89ED|nr:HAD-IIIA family hydrolase [Lacticaseibacillus parakribbianus]
MALSAATAISIHSQTLSPIQAVPAALQQLREHGLRCLVLTNQTRIASGELDEKALVASLLALGVDDVFVCPHPAVVGCNCRKPHLGLFRQASMRYAFTAQEAVVIGDSNQADMGLALAAGCLGLHVATGRNEPASGLPGIIEQPDFAAATNWVLTHYGSPI